MSSTDWAREKEQVNDWLASRADREQEQWNFNLLSARERELWFLKLLLPGFKDPTGPFTNAKALQSSGFGKLPAELILHISNYLPATSAAAFSVTCHAFYLVLGNQYFLALEQRTPNCHWQYHPSVPTRLVLEEQLEKQQVQAWKALQRKDLVLERYELLLVLARELPVHIAKYISILDGVNAPPRCPTNHNYWSEL